MAKQRKNKAGHSFAGTAGGINYYRNAEGKFTDEDAHLVEPGYAKVLESFFPQTVEEEVVAAQTPKKPAKRKVTAEPATPETAGPQDNKQPGRMKVAGKWLLKDFFPEFFGPNKPKDKENAGKEDAEKAQNKEQQYKRDVSDLKFKLENISAAIDENGALLKESLTQEERAVKVLEDILKAVQDSNKGSSAGGGLSDIPGLGGGKGGAKPSAKSKGAPKFNSKSKAAAALTAAATVGTGAAILSSNRGGSGSIAEKNETAAIAAAKAKSAAVTNDNNISVKANDLIFNSKSLKFNTDKIYLNVNQVTATGTPTAGAAAPSATDEGGAGGANANAPAAGGAGGSGGAGGAGVTAPSGPAGTGDTSAPSGAAAGGPQTPAVTGDNTKMPTNAYAAPGGAAGGKPASKSQSEYYNTMYDSLYKAAQEKGLPNPEVVARLGATQTSLETGYGRHMVGNNAFGIKGSGPAGTVNAGTKEFVGGKMVGMKQGFRAYNSPNESAGDYIDMMMKNPKRYGGVLQAKSVEEAIAAQAASGYATDPNYGTKLAGINAKMSKAGGASAPAKTETAAAPAAPPPPSAVATATGEGPMGPAAPQSFTKPDGTKQSFVRLPDGTIKNLPAEETTPPAQQVAAAEITPAAETEEEKQARTAAAIDKAMADGERLKKEADAENMAIATGKLKKTATMEEMLPGRKVDPKTGEIIRASAADREADQEKARYGSGGPMGPAAPQSFTKPDGTKQSFVRLPDGTIKNLPAEKVASARDKMIEEGNAKNDQIAKELEAEGPRPLSEKEQFEADVKEDERKEREAAGGAPVETAAATPPPPPPAAPAPTMASAGASMGMSAPQGAGVQGPDNQELAMSTASPAAGSDKMYAHYYPHLYGKQAKNSPTTAVL